MRAYWLTFEGHKPGCVDAQSEYDAREIGKHLTKCKVETVKGLPYPASPRIYAYEHPVVGVTPSFCMHPEKCTGFGSCPRSYSCTE